TAEVCAQVKEVILDVANQVAIVSGDDGCHESEDGVQLIDLAVSGYAGGRFEDPSAVSQPGFARVARLRIDPGEVDHGRQAPGGRSGLTIGVVAASFLVSGLAANRLCPSDFASSDQETTTDTSRKQGVSCSDGTVGAAGMRR